jgi:hypothetical protein
MRKELESALDLARTLEPEELPRLHGELCEILATIQLRIATPSTQDKPDELLDVNEAAVRLHMSKSYVYRNHRKFGSKRIGRKVLFSTAGLQDYLRKGKTR